MAHADDVLLDDRPVVEFLGHVMAGRADEFHAALGCLMVRPRADEGRQEAVVDVDYPVPVARAEPRGKNLHVARQHDGVGRGLLDESRGAVEPGLLRFGTGRDRHVMVGDAIPLDQIAKCLMVGDDAGNVDRQVPDFTAVQKVGQAVVEFADQHDDARHAGGIDQPPLHLQFLRNPTEVLPKRLYRRAIGGMVEDPAHEKHPARRLVVLGGVGDRGAPPGEERRDAGHDARPVGTAGHQPEAQDISLHSDDCKTPWHGSEFARGVPRSVSSSRRLPRPKPP